MSPPTSSARSLPVIVIVCFTVDFALCGLYLANHLIGQPSEKLTSLMDLNGESSVAAWFSSTQLFGICILGTLFVRKKIHENRRAILLIGLPLIFLALSIDEAVQLHEWLGSKTDALLGRDGREGTAFFRTGIWMFVLGLPFLALFLGWTYSIREFTADKPHCLRWMVMGMLLLLTGALGFEALSNWTTGLQYVLGVVAEEFCEMAGATIILWAVYDLAVDGVPKSTVTLDSVTPQAT